MKSSWEPDLLTNNVSNSLIKSNQRSKILEENFFNSLCDLLCNCHRNVHLKCIFTYLCVYVYTCMHIHMCKCMSWFVCVWGGGCQRTTWPALSFHQVGYESQTQVIKFSDKYLYLLVILLILKMFALGCIINTFPITFLNLDLEAVNSLSKRPESK